MNLIIAEFWLESLTIRDFIVSNIFIEIKPNSIFPIRQFYRTSDTVGTNSTNDIPLVYVKS